MELLKRNLGRWPILAAILLAIGAGVWTFRFRQDDAQAADLTQIFTVERGNLVAVVSPTGEIYAPRQTELDFDVNKLELIERNVSPGQEVKAGDVLARIDPTTLERAVTQAEADLTVAQDELDSAQHPFTELDLTQARVAVAQAELALEDAKQSLEDLQSPASELELAQAKLAVAQAETELADAQKSHDELLNPDVAAAQAAVRDAAAALQSAQSQLIAAENDPDNAERIRTMEYEATWYRNNYWEAEKKFEEGKIDQQKLNWEYSNMLAAEEKLKAAQATAEASRVNARNAVAKAEETLQDAREELATLRGGPDTLELTRAEEQVTQAENTLAEAQESLAELEAGADPLELKRAETQLAQAEYDQAKARTDLADIEAGPDPKEIEVAQAKLVSAQATLQEAQAALAAATLVAPFDGTVISVGADVGDLVSSGTVVVSLADLSILRVRAFVDETDISQVEIGQDASITFDAFPGQRFRGQVLEVPLQGELSQNVLTYEVPVSLEGSDQAALKPGMTANVSITVGRHQNVLLVPALAVQQGEEGNVVLVQDNPQGPGVAAPVQIGLSDGTYVEIVRGLNEGDRVLVEYQPVDDQFMGPGGFGRMITVGGQGPRR